MTTQERLYLAGKLGMTKAYVDLALDALNKGSEANFEHYLTQAQGLLTLVQKKHEQSAVAALADRLHALQDTQVEAATVAYEIREALGTDNERKD